MKRILFSMAIMATLFMGGCLGDQEKYKFTYTPVYSTNYSYNPATYAPEEKQEEPKIKYSYPTKTANINTIFNNLEKYKKDEFTTTDQYIENVTPIIDRIMEGKDYIIFKAVNKKDVDGSNIPTISYKAEKQEALVILSSSYFDYWGSPDSLRSKEAYFVTENIKTTRETGANVFGITNTYDMRRGNRTGLYFENINSFIEVPYMASDVARSLKGNMDVFFVVTLHTDTKVLKTIRYHDISTPTIDSAVAWSIKDKILVSHLKAVLLCNKKTKEVVETLYF